MSGDGAGTLLGLLFLIGALPFIITAAVAGAAVVGCAKIVQVGVSAAVEHRKKTKLELEDCSAQLGGLYESLEHVISQQDKACDEYFRNLDSQFSTIEKKAKKAEAESRKENATLAESLLQQVKHETRSALGQAASKEYERIQGEAKKEAAVIEQALSVAQQARVNAVDWRLKTAAAAAQQQVVTNGLLDDAKASIKLLRTMAEVYLDASFTAQTDALAHALDTAIDLYEKGMYQSASTSAQTVITRGAILALEHEQDRSERDFARAILRCRLEGLKAELESLDAIKFNDPKYGVVEERMDDFTQNAFNKLISDIDSKLNELNSPEAYSLSPHQLHLQLQEIENDLVPRADSIVRTGHERLAVYYERLHALDAIKEYLSDQGFACDWMQMAGDDATQKAVAHFIDPGSGAGIAVSLDDVLDGNLLNSSAMEVMFYYDNGHVVTEARKEQIRTGMLSALGSQGVGGSVSCSGALNTQSTDTTMRNKDSVKAMRPKKLTI